MPLVAATGIGGRSSRFQPAPGTGSAPPDSSAISSTLLCRRVVSIISPAFMPDVFWIGLTIAVAIFLIGVISGARSRTTSLLTGAAIGAYLGVMLAFPLLAIGLATS